VSEPADGHPAAEAGPDGRHGPHAFVVDLAAPELAPDDRHHLERALRLRAGDALTVSDGRGGWRPCRFGAELEPTGPIRFVDALLPRIPVAFALVKGGRPELVVQKLTELGADEIVPFAAARSVVRWDDDKAARQAERLRRVAREASMQCRRCHLPDVASPTTFADLAGRPGAVLAERHGSPPDLVASVSLVVMVGPEGGWTDEERAAVPDHVGFGAQVLRAETAAIAVTAVLGALRSGVVRPA
jgi:16S rRNA (uracil1498-N3)-methyltransferase